jgi:hypothetical protein
MKRIYTTPYTWNCNEQKFTLIRSLSYVRIFRALSLLIALHTPLIFWNLLQTLRLETNILLKIYGLGYTSITFTIGVVRGMHQNVAGDIVELLNLTIAFQKLSTNSGTN